MTHWYAQSNDPAPAHNARVYVQEALYSPEERRPLYAVGDRFDFVPYATPHVPGEIVAVASQQQFTVNFRGFGQFDCIPTPRSWPPPALQSQIPFDDRILVQLP